MPFVNLPASLQSLFNALDMRVLKLETSKRFTAALMTTTEETAAFNAGAFRPGDIWLNTTTNTLRAMDNTNTLKTITWS